MAKKILIIDDDARNIFALSACLKAKDFACISATNAKAGIQLLSDSNNIGIVLLDMMMPDMDGYEAISVIRQLEPAAHLPIIAVTAQAMVGDKEKCLQAGADNYISKPVDVDVLLQLLQRYLK